MKVLVDTSVWIEALKKSSKINRVVFDDILEDGRLVTCLPVHAELFSGNISPSLEKVCRRFFELVQFVDLDWNTAKTWEDVIEVARFCYKSRIKVPGLVDRMIFLAGQKSQSQIWTLDNSLLKLAQIVGINFNPNLNPK